MTSSARYHARRKARLHDRLGRTCASCGFHESFTGPMHVDHRFNNGIQARRERGTAGEITHMLALPDSILHEYAQLLCEPCHEDKTLRRSRV